MKEAILEVVEISKYFNGCAALKQISFSVHKSEIFGIIGMSGAGKSTLIRCLSGLESPSMGHIRLGQQEITALSAKELKSARKKLGMIFQHFNLFSSRSVLENVLYPLEIAGISKQERLDRAHELLQLVGLLDKKEAYPAQLSGGQKQRVAIARALANKPDILLCDEATSALDPSTTHAILELLLQLNQQLSLTIILITHEMEVIKRICTHVAILEQGELVEQGTTANLFSMPMHPTTKRFLLNVTHEIPEKLLPQGNHREVWRLAFAGKSAGQPIICQLIRNHAIEVNILLGGIDVLKSETIGNLVIAITGESSEREKARQFLIDNGVKLEAYEFT